ncbi:hypothetical protein C8J56DRAFT_897436 [Mycena floridula]|nr:hypothetical protein C8J56DRAFT_897436 [Mycena floridula]
MISASRLTTLTVALMLADANLAFGIPSNQLARRVNVQARSIAGLIPSRFFRRSDEDDCIPCSDAIGCCIINSDISYVDDVARDSDDDNVSDQDGSEDATSELEDAAEDAAGDDSDVVDDGRTLPGAAAGIDGADSDPSPSTPEPIPGSQANSGTMKMNVKRVLLVLPAIAFCFSI